MRKKYRKGQRTVVRAKEGSSGADVPQVPGGAGYLSEQLGASHHTSELGSRVLADLVTTDAPDVERAVREVKQSLLLGGDSANFESCMSHARLARKPSNMHLTSINTLSA